MRFISTRKKASPASFVEAIMKGLADDGGLFVPEALPLIDVERLGWDPFSDPFYKLAYLLILPFFKGEALEDKLLGICERAFDFPIRLSYLKSNPRHALLELYHGPTFAFKDFGARFLAECMESVAKISKGFRKKLILVATSGDTGSAVGSAFWGKSAADVKILFPKGMVSQRQKAQLCSFSQNVSSYQVEGAFDDCQRMVKQAFMDPTLKAKYDFSSANSINLGRLIPQMTYYFYASIRFFSERGERPIIIVPTGNAGNVTAAYYALLMGAPIKSIFLACNSNHSIIDYLDTGVFTGHETIRTLANAMDVGNPSNMERLMFMFPSHQQFKANISACCVSDDGIREVMRDFYKREGVFLCPHTACAANVMQERFGDDCAIAVSTASPVKFSDTIEDTLGKAPAEDERFSKALSSKQSYVEIKADYHLLF